METFSAIDRRQDLMRTVERQIESCHMQNLICLDDIRVKVGYALQTYVKLTVPTGIQLRRT